MKKKIVLMSIAAVLAMTAIIGGTLAGFNTQSEQGKTDITTKSLGIELTNNNGEIEGENSVSGKYMPGSVTEIPFSVTNNVEEGYDLYTRVTIYKSWKDRTDLDASVIHLYAKDASGNPVELMPDAETGETVMINDWFIQYADDEQIILYYAKPMVAGDVTANVVDTLMIDASIDNTYADQEIVVEVVADAVQRIAAESSMPSEWGVYPTFDENGNIVSIAE